MAGGVERYLAGLVPRLRERGAEIAFLFENDEAEGSRARVAGKGVEWHGPLKHRGEVATFLGSWKPELIYAHGFRRATLDREAAGAKTVWFLHQYTGACVDGAKTHRWPVIEPCSRPFGPGCLVQYFPRRCGGLNPLTLWRLYREQRYRQETLRRARVLLTHSAHLEREYSRYGLGVPIRRVPFPAGPEAKVQGRGDRDYEPPWRLVFMGRMELPKGGDVLLRAVDRIAERQGEELVLTMAGDGSARGAWESLASGIQSRHRHLSIRFTGWLGEEAKAEMLGKAHLMVVPSLWPEPLGMVGPEAAFYAVPSVAFDRGGISEWLRHDENGWLVHAGTDPANRLADALEMALQNRARLRSWSVQALAGADRFGWESHVRVLEEVFGEVSRGGRS